MNFILGEFYGWSEKFDSATWSIVSPRSVAKYFGLDPEDLDEAINAWHNHGRPTEYIHKARPKKWIRIVDMEEGVRLQMDLIRPWGEYTRLLKWGPTIVEMIEVRVL